MFDRVIKDPDWRAALHGQPVMKVTFDGEQAISYRCTHYIPEDVMQDILMLSHAVVMREYMGIDEVM